MQHNTRSNALLIAFKFFEMTLLYLKLLLKEFWMTEELSFSNFNLFVDFVLENIRSAKEKIYIPLKLFNVSGAEFQMFADHLNVVL